MRPGLFAGGTIVLIWSFTELGTPLVFDYYTVTPVQVFKQITDVSDNPLPYALVVVMLLASAAIYIVGKVILGRQFDAASTKASIASTTRRLSSARSEDSARGQPYRIPRSKSSCHCWITHSAETASMSSKMLGSATCSKW